MQIINYLVEAFSKQGQRYDIPPFGQICQAITSSIARTWNRRNRHKHNGAMSSAN